MLGQSINQNLVRQYLPYARRVTSSTYFRPVGCELWETVADRCRLTSHRRRDERGQFRRVCGRDVNEALYVLQLRISYVITDHCGGWRSGISVGGNALASVRLSVCLFPFYLRNRLTIDLELLQAGRSRL